MCLCILLAASVMLNGYASHRKKEISGDFYSSMPNRVSLCLSMYTTRVNNFQHLSSNISLSVADTFISTEV